MIVRRPRPPRHRRHLHVAGKEPNPVELCADDIRVAREQIVAILTANAPKQKTNIRAMAYALIHLGIGLLQNAMGVSKREALRFVAQVLNDAAADEAGKGEP